MEKFNHSNMVLRFFIGDEKTEERFNLMVDFLKRSGIRRVVLFSAAFTETSSILSEEYYKNHAELLRPYVEKLKSMGVEAGINVLHTNGHCFYADESEFGFKRAVTISGEKSRGSVCMLDKGFQEHIKKEYKYYASLNPSVIFTDDDIRMISLGQFICLCPEHVKAISQKVGRELSFEEIRDSVLTDNFEENPVREAFFSQLREDIEFTLSQIADAVHEVSPETEIGVMTTSYPSVTADRDLKGLFEKFLESKKTTRIRAGMDYYREGDHNNIPLAFSQPAIQREFIDNPKVEIQPEIENDTYSFYMKSNNVTNMQILWCLTNGFRNMQMNLFNMNMPIFNYDEITDMFADNIDYHNKIVELIPENYRTSGIGIYAHPNALTKRRAINQNIFFEATWHKWFNLLGMPVSSDTKSSDFMMLVGDDIFLASDSEIDEILKKGAIMDLRAAEALLERGYGKRIGVSKISKFDNILAGEHFTDDELNGEFKGVSNSDYLYSTLIDSEEAKHITYLDGAKVLSVYTDHHKEKICDAVCSYENENGERFVILPFVDTVFTYFININHKRRRQLINCFEWIAQKQLPVCAENEKMCVNINRFEDKNVITLLNLQSDDVKAPKLRYKPVGELKYVDKSGEILPLENEIINDSLTVINKELRAMNVLVIIDEFKK